MARLRKKCRRQEPQVRADHPAFPARWRYGLYVISPGIGFLAPVASALVELGKRQLSISTAMPGPHDFAVRIGSFAGMIAHAATRYAHRIPHPTLVTIAKRPSSEAGRAQHSIAF